MTLTEAYIISIPETYLIIAISILILNGLVGIKHSSVGGSGGAAQNQLLNRQTVSTWNATIYSTASHPNAISNVELQTDSKNSQSKLLATPSSRVYATKSVVPLGILSLSLAMLLLSNIDITYVGRFIMDDYSKTIKLIVLGGSIVLLLICFDTVRNLAQARLRLFRSGQNATEISRSTLVNYLEPNLELVVLIILAVVGLMVIVSSYDLLSLYVGIELQSLALYVLAAYKRSSEFSTEAGLKYFILGAIASGFILFGSSIVYGVTGTIQFEEIAKLLLLQDQTVVIGLLFVFAGLFFKSSIAPFHQWTPDVYEGSPTLVTLLFASVPKLAIFSILVRLLSLLTTTLSSDLPLGSAQLTNFNIINNILMVCAILSMTVGAITGLYQQKLKRLLAYSTILNMGYVLIGLISFSIDGLQALFFYLLIYLFTNIGVFTLILAVKELRNQSGTNQLRSLVYITDLYKLRNHPLLAFSLTIIIASFAGFPPLAGFFAKLYVFFSAIALQYYLLLFVAVILSVISCFYYLRLIKYIYFSPLPSGLHKQEQTNRNATVFIMPISFIHSVVISVVVLSLIVFMFYPGPLLTLSLSLALNVLA